MTVSEVNIFQILPRNMNYSQNRATSIDLCVSEITNNSIYNSSTTIFAECDGLPLTDTNLIKFKKDKNMLFRALKIINKTRILSPDVIIVQQHLPTANILLKFAKNVPIILHTHNFQKLPKEKANYFRRLSYRRRVNIYNKLAGIVLVSDSVKKQFQIDYPEVKTPLITIPNGINLSQWSPQEKRDNEILVVGRSAPEKGILEAAEGIVLALMEFPDWRATFILSEIETHPAYSNEIFRILAKLGSRAKIITQARHSEVINFCCRAAIAVIPSKWAEPFGRTAMEAHAGGAAVISSGTGGLSEISQDSALILNSVTMESISGAIKSLIMDEGLRINLSKRGMLRVNNNFNIQYIAQEYDHFVSRIFNDNKKRLYK